MHYSNKRYETEWSFLNHKKGTKSLRLKITTLCRLSKKNGLITDKFHNFRYEHLWNHDFNAQESNIIFDIFFDIISILFSMFSMFFSIYFFD